MMLDDIYQIRPISVPDAATVALHRSLMFRDMGLLDEAEAEQLRTTSEPWIESLLLDGTYVGWFVQSNGAVVGGCGLHLSTFGPKPGFSDGGKSAHVANVCVDPVYRRRGSADEMMAATLQWARRKRSMRLPFQRLTRRSRSMNASASRETQAALP